jgi:hypothetical protein
MSLLAHMFTPCCNGGDQNFATLIGCAYSEDRNKAGDGRAQTQRLQVAQQLVMTAEPRVKPGVSAPDHPPPPEADQLMADNNPRYCFEVDGVQQECSGV